MYLVGGVYVECVVLVYWNCFMWRKDDLCCSLVGFGWMGYWGCVVWWMDCGIDCVVGGVWGVCLVVGVEVLVCLWGVGVLLYFG